MFPMLRPLSDGHARAFHRPDGKLVHGTDEGCDAKGFRSRSAHDMPLVAIPGHAQGEGPQMVGCGKPAIHAFGQAAPCFGDSREIVPVAFGRARLFRDHMVDLANDEVLARLAGKALGDRDERVAVPAHSDWGGRCHGPTLSE